MKEIKFRAWIEKENRMLTMDDDSWVFNFCHNDNYITDNVRDGSFLWTKEELELMQFTGLTDKNGKEIYEGDIVKGSQHRCTYDLDLHFKISMVEYLDEISIAAFDAVSNLNKNCSSLSGPSLNSEDIEIIGNIYQQPELLLDKDGE